MHRQLQTGEYRLQLYHVPHSGQIQNVHSLYADGIPDRALQRNAEIHWRHHIQNAQFYLKAARGGRTCEPKGISADPTESRVQSDRKRKIPYSHIGSDVRMGRPESRGGKCAMKQFNWKKTRCGGSYVFQYPNSVWFPVTNVPQSPRT